MTRARLVDWKFWVALAFAIMVTYLVWVGYSSYADKQDLQDALTSQQSREDAKDRIAAAERAAATAERDVLLQKQNELLDQLQTFQRKQDKLLDYLREQGIVIPGAFTSGPAGANGADGSSGGRGGSGSSGGGGTPPSSGGGTLEDLLQELDGLTGSLPLPLPIPSLQPNSTR